VGVRGGKNQRLYGFISGIPVSMTTLGKTQTYSEINFLCVHKQLRHHRLAPVLIKEITRRVNLCDIWQAIYTSGTTLPTLALLLRRPVGAFGLLFIWGPRVKPRFICPVPARQKLTSSSPAHSVGARADQYPPLDARLRAPDFQSPPAQGPGAGSSRPSCSAKLPCC
jgi:hypothetical protein